MNPMFHDYLLFGIFLLVLGFLAAITNSKRRVHYFLTLFVFSALVSGSFFTDPQQVGPNAVRIFYPWAMPFFFALGPSLLLSYYDEHTLKSPMVYLHFLPTILLGSIQILQFATSHDMFQAQYALAQEFLFTQSSSSMVVSDAIILLAYPIHSVIYAVIILQLKRAQVSMNELIMPLTMVVFGLPLWDLVHHFIYGHGLVFKSATLLRAVLIMPVFALLYDMFLGRRFFNTYPKKTPKAPEGIYVPADLIEDMRGSAPVGKEELAADDHKNASAGGHHPTVNFSPDQLQFFAFLERESHDHESLFFHEGIHKERILKNSPFSMDEWNVFFRVSGKTFTYYKKWVRIQKALSLIDSGYLHKYSVESLSVEVGYSSRSSFYAAFEEISGQPLSDYRLDVSRTY